MENNSSYLKKEKLIIMCNSNKFGVLFGRSDYINIMLGWEGKIHC